MSDKKRVHLNYAQSRQLDQWLHANLTRLAGHGYDFAADACNDSGELDFRVTGNNVERMVDQVDTLAAIRSGQPDGEAAALRREVAGLAEEVGRLRDKVSVQAVSVNMTAGAIRRITQALIRLDPAFSATVPDIPVLVPDIQVPMGLEPDGRILSG